ncbi:MAG: glycosyltransferase family 1 protein [Candidatus Shapirobacteria bacterium]|jgi:glycosyltransferase involved in cell wall biosynthesis
MLIGIDGNEANYPIRVGIGQFAFNLLCSLHRQNDHRYRYLIFLKNPPLKDMPQERPNWQYQVFGPPKLWTKYALPGKLFTQNPKPDLFYSPGHYTPLFSPCPIIPTIHDLAYQKYPRLFTIKDYFQLKLWTFHSLFRARHIVSVSDFTKQELVSRYHLKADKITVAHNGVDPVPTIKPKQAQSVLSKFNISEPFFLYLGTLKPNKNIPFLIDAFSLFLSRHPDFLLVIAGKKGWLYSEIFAKVTALKLNSRIVFTDFVTETEKWVLYQNAFSVLMPSLYEGFGIPAIEAMQAGTPVIVSNIPPLVEVVGADGLITDLDHPTFLAEKMALLLDPATRAKIINYGRVRAKKFTWDKCAKSVMRAFSLAKTG